MDFNLFSYLLNMILFLFSESFAKIKSFEKLSGAIKK